MNTAKNAQNPFHELVKVINIGDIAMLTTVGGKGNLHSRPMETCYVGVDGKLYFFTTFDSDLFGEVAEEVHVNLSYIHEPDCQYISVAGKVTIENKNDDIAAYWREEYSRWIPAGLLNPNIILLIVEPVSAEYWEETGTVQQITRRMIYGEDTPKSVHKVMP